MREVLGDEGYDVQLRKVWDNAYNLVKDTRPDLVILDVLLDTQGKGFELVDLLTLDPITRHIPVLIASTATEMLLQRTDAFTQMGIPVIGKPFDLETLISVVHRQLEAGTRERAHQLGLGGPVDLTEQKASDGATRNGH